MDTEHDIDQAYRSFARKAFQDAADRVRRVLRRSPQNAAALTLVGRLALINGDPLLAYHSFQQVLRQHPDKAALWLDLSRSLRDLGRHEDALGVAEEALKLGGSDVEARVLAGEICLGLGEKARAASLFRQALDGDTDCLPAYRGLCTSEELEPDSRPVRRMVGLLQSKRLALGDSARLHYSLAQIYRRSGNRKAFFDHLFAANEQQRKLCPDGRDEYAAHFDRIEAAFTSDALQRVAPIPAISPAPIFIVGMPRSGTTLVERIISGHPDVAAGGEIDFMRGPLRHRFEKSTGSPFPLNFEQVPAQELEALVTQFQQRLAILGPESRYVTDKTPGNFHLLSLLHVLFDGGKIVHVNRDPLDTCFSILQYPFDDNSPHTCDVRLLAYVYRRYIRLMEHWKRLLGDAFLTVEYENLVRSPASEGRRMFEYCGLDWQEEYLDVSRSGGNIRTFSSVQARLPIYRGSAGIAQQFSEELAPLRVALEQELAGL